MFKPIWIGLFAFLTFNHAMADTLGFSVSPAPVPGKLTVNVLDEVSKNVIVDADVSVLSAFKAPHQVITRSFTDLDGRAEFAVQPAPTAISTRVIAVSKIGYGSVAVAGVQDSIVTIFLKPVPGLAKDSIMSGTLGGWKPSATKNSVQAGIILKQMGAMDLIGLHFRSFISPLQDTINVFGARKIPSNVVIPEQDVMLPIGSITLKKPDYRLPLAPGQTLALTGLQAETKVSDLLPFFQGGKKVTFDILNKLKTNRVGLSSTIVTDKDQKVDFISDIELTPTHQVQVDLPPFTADVISLSATDLNGDRQSLLPTDIKTPVTKEKPATVTTVNLSAPKQFVGIARLVATVAIDPSYGRFSAILTDSPGKLVKPGAFLNVNSEADFHSLPAQIKVKAPSAQSIAVLSFEAQSSELYPQWTIIALPAAGEVLVDTAHLTGLSGVEQLSKIQLEFAPGFNELDIDGGTVLRQLTRFTRSTAKQL